MSYASMEPIDPDQLARCSTENLKRLARSLGIDVSFALRHTRAPDHGRQLAALICEVREAMDRDAAR